MKVIAINGSPRKNWNTATLLQYALDGAASQGAETKLYHLIDYDFKGCRSCFACKRIGSKSYGKCAARDGLTPILEEIDQEADAFILGTPIYIGGATAEMRALIERLLYPYAKYDKFQTNLFSRRIPVGFVYTMNWTEELLKFMNVGLLRHAAVRRLFQIRHHPVRRRREEKAAGGAVPDRLSERLRYGRPDGEVLPKVS